MESGFAPSFKEAVGRWRRRHRHPPAHESWFAVHYRVGWLVERLSTLESIHLLRQGLDVRALSAERPARKRKGDSKQDQPEAEGLAAEAEDLQPGSQTLEPGSEELESGSEDLQPAKTADDAGPVKKVES